MTDAKELTLFGKAMHHAALNSKGDAWLAEIGNLYVDIFEHEGRWRVKATFHREASQQTPEGARDAAESALRKLYDALGEVVEPWVFDRDPEPPANPMYHDSYLCMWDDTWVSESDWDGERWRRYGKVVVDRPYAWRQMPKGPGRKAT